MDGGWREREREEKRKGVVKPRVASSEARKSRRRARSGRPRVTFGRTPSNE
jgi:hypothetical protein